MLDIKKAYLADRALLKKAGEELTAESVDDFMMWCDANGVDLTAKEEELQEVEFSPEEQEFLNTVTKAVISRDGDKTIVKLVAGDDETGAIEIEISDEGGEKEDSLEEEHEDALEEVLEEGVE